MLKDHVLDGSGLKVSHFVNDNYLERAGALIRFDKSVSVSFLSFFSSFSLHMIIYTSLIYNYCFGLQVGNAHILFKCNEIPHIIYMSGWLQVPHCILENVIPREWKCSNYRCEHNYSELGNSFQ